MYRSGPGVRAGLQPHLLFGDSQHLAAYEPFHQFDTVEKVSDTLSNQSYHKII
jgi:hypothetical protein